MQAYKTYEVMNKDNMRVKLLIDELAHNDNPLNWNNDVIEVVISQDRYMGRMELPFELENVIAYCENDDAKVKAIQKHYERQGMIVYQGSWRGYCQGDWREALYVGDSKVWELEQLKSFVEKCYFAWLRGDVYGIVLEEKYFTGYDNEGEKHQREEWEVQESIWGIIDDNLWSVEQVQVYVNEYFGSEFSLS